MGAQETTIISVLLKPFLALLFFCALAAVRVALQKWMPDSRLKRILLFKV